MFRENKLAEYHLERSIYEELINHYLNSDSSSYIKIIITKESDNGIFIGRLEIFNYSGNRDNKIFNIRLHNESNDILKVEEFLFSSNCCNCGIEEQIYRYIAILAKEAGYKYLRPSNIVYTSNDEFDFSESKIVDVFSTLNKLKKLGLEDMESFKKEVECNQVENEFNSIFNLFKETSIDFNLHNLISFEDIVDVDTIILETNRKLTEMDKNYLIKMARKLYCQYKHYPDTSCIFSKRCVLLSNIVHFLASEKLLIPDADNTILDGCMDKKGAHTVSIILGRQVDATADQFVYDDHTLDPYEDNSLYFNYFSSKPNKYQPEMISEYISLFNKTFKKLSVYQFLFTEDNNLYKRSLEVQILS